MTGRILGSIVCGVLAGVIVVSAVGTAGDHYFEAFRGEDTRQWGILFWGDHRIVRMLAGGFAAAATGYVAGAVARAPFLPGILSASPAALLWLLTAALPLISSVDYPLRDRTLAFLMVVLGPGIAAGMCRLGSEHARACAHHFDSRPGTLLGVKWYHYLWLWPVVYLIGIQCAGSIFFALGRPANTLLVIPSVLMLLGMLWTVALCFGGAARSYVLLAGLAPSVTPGRDVLRSIAGYPLVATALQLCITFLYGALDSWLR